MPKKNQVNTQFARTSFSGTRSAPAPADNEGIEPLADRHGRLWVNIPGFTPPTPDPFTTTNQASEIAGSPLGEIVFAGNARLDILSGYVRSAPANPFWFHIFDRAILPTLGLAPTIIMPIQDNQLEFCKAQPRIFPLGIVIAPSSTELTFTAIAAPCTFMWEASYSTP